MISVPAGRMPALPGAARYINDLGSTASHPTIDLGSTASRSIDAPDDLLSVV